MTSPSFQDNLTPGGDVMVGNREDNVNQNAFLERSNVSRGRGRRCVCRNSCSTKQLFNTAGHTVEHVPCGQHGNADIICWATQRSCEGRGDQAQAFYPIHRSDRTPALCFMQARRNHVQVLHCWAVS